MNADAEREKTEIRLRQEFEDNLPAVIEDRVLRFQEQLEQQLRETFEEKLPDRVEECLEEMTGETALDAVITEARIRTTSE